MSRKPIAVYKEEIVEPEPLPVSGKDMATIPFEPTKKQMAIIQALHERFINFMKTLGIPFEENDLFAVPEGDYIMVFANPGLEIDPETGEKSYNVYQEILDLGDQIGHPFLRYGPPLLFVRIPQLVATIDPSGKVEGYSKFLKIHEQAALDETKRQINHIKQAIWQHVGNV